MRSQHLKHELHALGRDGRTQAHGAGRELARQHCWRLVGHAWDQHRLLRDHAERLVRGHRLRGQQRPLRRVPDWSERSAERLELGPHRGRLQQPGAGLLRRQCAPVDLRGLSGRCRGQRQHDAVYVAVRLSLVW